MSRFFWVRHGPTHARAMLGWTDLPADLTDTDRISRLAAHLPGDALVVSSDLIRAVATADAIAGPRPRLPHDRDLREINFGEWEMQRVDTVTDQAALRAFWDNPGSTCAPGGECWNDLRMRTDRAVARLMAAHPGRDIVAVAHMGTIMGQLERALGVTAYEAFGHRIDPLSVTELKFHGGDWQVEAINHCL